ncbi:hypothetical protein [Brachybacterium sacelli]|uniref:Membrane associated rhomboid family serine protease n=1 Tax=Brachybacterium sacelli TaxID=173364 RepID=A0ABS4WZI8_9MICO|nr:hypothetical protein [Brachybacterium sacelli]MBP2381617.1 membrane associated rhomboid family serine protease [Brachybacterium sacelli]
MNAPQVVPPPDATAHTAAQPLRWPLILGLGLAGLARPLSNIVLDQTGLDLGAAVPLAWTLLISLLWIGAVGLTRTPRPVLTLILTGLAYAVCAILLSGILSPLLLGHLTGPLAHPIALVPMLLTNGAWGALTGALALLLQRARGADSREHA